VLLLLTACTAPLQTLKLDSETTLPPHTELSDTAFYPQKEYQCGPAALATILNYYGARTSPEQLKPQIYLPARQGTLRSEVVAATRRYDMIAVELTPTLDALLSEIAAGNPVLVFQNLAFDWWPQWHYAVAIGYDLDTKEIILRSGTRARWITPLSVFETTWRRADYWALVIKPAGEIPATAEPLTYLKAASALESIARHDAAFAAYQAAVRRWPDNIIAFTGLGNTAYVQGNYTKSAKAFAQAITIESRPELWNNIAFPLNALGCHTEALSAVACAIALDPDNPAYRASLTEIKTTTENMNGQSCSLPSCPVAPVE
jgi:tetratricopeptide (TPR) repeat protein